MKRNNKVLYESIMRNVSKEVGLAEKIKQEVLEYIDANWDREIDD